MKTFIKQSPEIWNEVSSAEDHRFRLTLTLTPLAGHRRGVVDFALHQSMERLGRFEAIISAKELGVGDQSLTLPTQRDLAGLKSILGA